MSCWWCFPLTVIEILSVCLRRPCVWFAICMSVHRSKCHLETIRLFNTRYGGLVVRITVLCLCFYTSFNVKIPTPNCMKMHHLKWRITTIFCRGSSAPSPNPTIPPRRLDARAFHGQLPRMSSDPRNVPGCDAALWKVEPLIQISQSLLQLQRIAKVVYSLLNY